MESQESVKLDRRNAELGRGSWGCVCGGRLTNAAATAITCVDCLKWFHAKCERLDYTANELHAMASRRKYVCKACESERLRKAGFDLTKGRFEWQCRFCSKTFADEAEATTHGKRCAVSETRRQWSCPCNGELSSKGGTAAAMSQCEGCGHYFHKNCKRRARAEWEGGREVDTLCLRCEKSSGEKSGSADVGRASGRNSALSSDPSDEVLEGGAAAARARKRKGHTNMAALVADLLPVSEEEVGGTLKDGTVFVKQSLIKNGGFGLFAGKCFKSGDVITSYEGPIIYRNDVDEEVQDTTYVLRIPNSGGALIDGKPIGDAIRANTNNPGAWGRYFPKEDAPEFTQGAASMANDPRDSRLYNSRLSFVKRQGFNKALAELAPMRAILHATRDIKIGEEIYYNYGSSKPFEKMRKELHRKQVELQKKERDVCRSVWVPFATSEQTNATTADATAS